MLENLKISISKNLDYFKDLSSEEIVNERKNKFLKIGRNKGFISSSEDLSTLTIKNNNIDKILKSKKVLIGSSSPRINFIDWQYLVYFKNFYKAPQQCLNFLPEPQKHGSFLPHFFTFFNLIYHSLFNFFSCGCSVTTFKFIKDSYKI